MNIYGYCRISRKKQNIERQVRNIQDLYPDAHILKETFTGTKIQGRKTLDRLLKIVKPGDTIVFDSASRMSRNADEAIILYEQLYNEGVNLVFLKEPQINTDTYRKALNNQIQISMNTGNEATDTFISGIIDTLNRYTIDLAKEQIKLVFAQAQKEVDDLHKRTSEGLLTAKLNGKRIGQQKGNTYETKKAKQAKAIILKYSHDFNGILSTTEVIKLACISRNSYYKYKRELYSQIASAE